MAGVPNDRQYGESYRIGSEEKAVERLIFNRRKFWLIIIGLLTCYFIFETGKIRIDARFEKMLPMEHPYLQNMFAHLDDLAGQGMPFRIALENTEGDIYDTEYLQVLQEVHDKVFFINGVDKTSLRSMWAPSVRWQAVTPEGFEGDRLIPGDYDGTPETLDKIRVNVSRSTEIGRLIADNFKSSIVEANLFTTYPMDDEERGHKMGQTVDFYDFGNQLDAVRAEVEEKYNGRYKLYIIGEPKMIGDFISGSLGIIWFGVIAIGITIVLLYLYARCWRAALTPLFTSVIAVFWMLGILSVMGRYGVPYGQVLVGEENIEQFFGIGVFSMLVPFLLVAIGVSHSVQYVNAMAIEMAHGHNREVAARRAFRSNYLPGITALLANAFSFLTMMLIPISAIKELAVTACIGTAVLIVLKLMLLPILMSYFGISKGGIEHMQLKEHKDPWYWTFLALFTQRRWAVFAIIFSAVLAAYSLWERQNLKVGDITAGAPELRPDSVYNQDNKFITENYATSSDLFVVMTQMTPGECFNIDNIRAMDDLEWHLQNVEGVQATVSAAFVAKNFIAGLTEGHVKWMDIGRHQVQIDGASNLITEFGLVNVKCSFAPLVAYLTDHKADTLNRVAAAVEQFARENNTDGIQFKLATGNAGIAAAVNQEIHAATNKMLFMVYAVVAALVFFTFPSLRAMLCILIPLGVTSVLCEAIMALMDIGLKVATLPVITLGVGVGVDYGIYIYARLETYLKEGRPLRDAYMMTLKTTGKAVSFTGFTLAFGVATWYWSDIQFQKDMGVLLVFMFLWNMVGALTLLPALAHFLIPGNGKRQTTA